MRRRWARGCGLAAMALLIGACLPGYANPVRVSVPTPEAPAGALSLAGLSLPGTSTCQVHAVDLIGAWVAAGNPERDPFAFEDVSGKPCHGTFEADVLPLFQQANLWFPGALSCRTCHRSDVNTAFDRMDLSSYQGILAGSGRPSTTEKGDDILGGGNWQKAALYENLSDGEMPPNGPQGRDPHGPIVSAGAPD